MSRNISTDVSTPQLLTSATSALKKLAATQSLRDAFVAGPLLADTLWPAASRYIVGRDRAELLAKLPVLADLGYRLGVEFVGEEVRDPEQIEQVVVEYEALIDAADPDASSPVQLGFDLSSVGLLVSPELARDNTARLLKAAAGKNTGIVISMERSEFVDRILDVFDTLVREHDNLGITLQAHLHRTGSDIDRIAGLGGRVRLVKGVYREAADVALPRGPELDQRYVALVRRLVHYGIPVATATQDHQIYNLLDQAMMLVRVSEVEMLHGVRPDVLRGLRDCGLHARVTTVYGRNWWLHFLHRLAEYAPNVLVALADLDDPGRIHFGRDYR
jgi:proline dehydrogenase